MAGDSASPNATAADSNQVRTASGLNVIAGIWLFISAFFLAPSLGMTWDNVCFGILVVILAAIRLGLPAKTQALSWINALCGVWVVISPWVFVSTYGATWNAVITGLVILGLGIWAAVAITHGPAPDHGA